MKKHLLKFRAVAHFNYLIAYCLKESLSIFEIKPGIAI